jgi:hypothetical protein
VADSEASTPDEQPDVGEGSMPPVDGLCGECGFDYEAVDRAAVVDKIRTAGRRYRAPLTRGLPGESLDDLLRAHPLPGGWSALEYACHVRDVFEVMRARVDRTLVEDAPQHESMGREERVVRDRYNEQDPEAVADALAVNAEALAAVFESLTEGQWGRRCLYQYPEPTERDLTWVGRHTAHESQHHLLDIGRTLRAARGRS